MQMGMMDTCSAIIPYTASISFITEMGYIYWMVLTESLNILYYIKFEMHLIFFFHIFLSWQLGHTLKFVALYFTHWSLKHIISLTEKVASLTE